MPSQKTWLCIYRQTSKFAVSLPLGLKESSNM